MVGSGLVATNAHVVAGEGSGDTQVLIGNNAYAATPVLFDPSFDLAVLRTDAPLGPALAISPNLVPRGTQAAVLGYPEDRALTVDPAGVTEEVTAIGKDIYNNGSVTRGVYALDADVLPGNSGGPADGAGRPGHRRGLLSFHRLSGRRLRPDLPGGPDPRPGGIATSLGREHRALHQRLSRQE